jgi:hypothetical protein
MALVCGTPSAARALHPTEHASALRGSLRAGQRAAVIMGLIQSAKLNHHDPYRHLKDVLERLPTQPASRIMNSGRTAGSPGLPHTNSMPHRTRRTAGCVPRSLTPTRRQCLSLPPRDGHDIDTSARDLPIAAFTRRSRDYS